MRGERQPADGGHGLRRAPPAYLHTSAPQGVERRHGGTDACQYQKVMLRTHSVAIDLATSLSVGSA